MQPERGPAPAPALGRPSNVLDVAERRLVRLGLDLHDGPVQNAAALLADVRIARDSVREGVTVGLLEWFADVADRLTQLHDELRELSVELESRTLVDRPLIEGLHREADAFRSRSDIELTLAIEGDATDLTASQQFATARIVQEAMSNIREHSGARHAQVRVVMDANVIRIRVWDDGRGFAPVRTMRDPGRVPLGLVGMSERARLLDGSLAVSSAPGGPTVVEAAIPRWRPSGDGAVSPAPLGPTPRRTSADTAACDHDVSVVRWIDNRGPEPADA